MIYTLLINNKDIAMAKGVNHIGVVFPNEIEITEEQYNQINEFPLKLVIENGQIVSWQNTELPVEEYVERVDEPSIEERLKQAEDTLLFLLMGGI